MTEAVIMPDVNMNELLDQIRAMLDTKIDKLETDIKGSIGELKSKVDDINSRHSESNERLTAVESVARSCEMARIDQGRRLGEIERDLSSFQVAIKTEAAVRDKMATGAGTWARWIPSLIAGIIAIVYFMERTMP